MRALVIGALIATLEALWGLDSEIQELGLPTRITEGDRWDPRITADQCHREAAVYEFSSLSESPSVRHGIGFLSALLLSSDPLESTYAASALSKVVTRGVPRNLRPRMSPRLNAVFNDSDQIDHHWSAVATEFLIEGSTIHGNRLARIETLTWMRLVYARDSQDHLESEIARTSLSWLGSYSLERTGEVNSRSYARGGGGEAVQSLIVHGTRSFCGQWWRPDGDFYQYLVKYHHEPLRAKRPPFSWSGFLRERDRRQGGQDLADLAHSEGPLDRVFAHSYGAEVVAHAIDLGADIERYVLLSAPVSPPLVHSLRRINPAQVRDIRLKIDPVLLGATCQQLGRLRWAGQKLPGDLKIQSHTLSIWTLDHGATHDPRVWDLDNLYAKI